MSLSFLTWVVMWSNLRSRVRFSKRVCALLTGFFLHRFWIVELKEPNENKECEFLSIYLKNVSKTLMVL